MSFYGELYLRSTLPFLTEAATAADVDRIAALVSQAPPGPILDLGCGHGRHAKQLAIKTGRTVFGVDLDALSLAMVEGFDGVMGDLMSLPFASKAFAAAYSWTSTLFGLVTVDFRRSLAEASRCLMPGGLLILQTIATEFARSMPDMDITTPMKDGSSIREESWFWDDIWNGKRTLTDPDGRTLFGEYAIHCYRPIELVELAEEAGFRLVRVTSAGTEMVVTLQVPNQRCLGARG